MIEIRHRNRKRKRCERSWKSSGRKFLCRKDFKVDLNSLQTFRHISVKTLPQLGGLELLQRDDQPTQRKPMKASHRIFLLASQKFPDPPTISNNRVHCNCAGVGSSVCTAGSCGLQCGGVCARVAHASRWFHRRAARGWSRSRSPTPCRCTGCRVYVWVAGAAVCGSAASAVAALLSSAATMKNYPEAGWKREKRVREEETGKGGTARKRKRARGTTKFKGKRGRWTKNGTERKRERRQREGRRGREENGERKRLVNGGRTTRRGWKREKEEDRRSGFFSRPRARVV